MVPWYHRWLLLFFSFLFFKSGWAKPVECGEANDLGFSLATTWLQCCCEFGGAWIFFLLQASADAWSQCLWCLLGIGAYGHKNGNNSGKGGHYLIIRPTTVANMGFFQIGADGALGRSKTHFLFFLADTPQQCHWERQLCCCYWRWQWWWYSFSLLFHMANNANFGIITCGDIGRADQFFHFLNVEYIDMILVVISFFPIWLANKVYLGLVLAVLLVGINNLSGKYMAMLPMGFYFFYTIGW